MVHNIAIILFSTIILTASMSSSLCCLAFAFVSSAARHHNTFQATALYNNLSSSPSSFCAQADIHQVHPIHDNTLSSARGWMEHIEQTEGPKYGVGAYTVFRCDATTTTNAADDFWLLLLLSSVASPSRPPPPPDASSKILRALCFLLRELRPGRFFFFGLVSSSFILSFVFRLSHSASTAIDRYLSRREWMDGGGRRAACVMLMSHVAECKIKYGLV